MSAPSLLHKRLNCINWNFWPENKFNIEQLNTNLKIIKYFFPKSNKLSKNTKGLKLNIMLRRFLILNEIISGYTIILILILLAQEFLWNNQSTVLV